MSVFYPMLILVLFTCIICLVLGLSRLISIKNGEVNPKQYRLMSGYEEPVHLKKLNRNYLNLFEIPVLFYIAGCVMLALKIETPELIALAWAFVVVRFIHSYIHITYNHPLHRFLIFGVSLLIVVAMWIMIALNLPSLS